MILAIRRLDSRQGAKHAKFRREKINYLEKKVYYYFPIFAALASLECQDKPGRSNILKGGYLVGCPFDK